MTQSFDRALLSEKYLLFSAFAFRYNIKKVE